MEYQKKHHMNVPFETKLFRYPVIVAESRGKKVDLSGHKPAHLLANDGKKVRDALTHPSPYVNPSTGDQEKVSLIRSLNFDFLNVLFDAAKQYVLFVEQGIGNQAKLTMPWFFER
jgi:hypothetical protein